jgi:hypothetical protein
MARVVTMATITQESASMPSAPIPRRPAATAICDGEQKTIVCSACLGNRKIVVPPVVFDCPICALANKGHDTRAVDENLYASLGQCDGGGAANLA